MPPETSHRHNGDESLTSFFKKLLNEVTIPRLQNKSIVDSDFKFDRQGWYFFISPISGIMKMKIIRNLQPNSNGLSVSRFIGFRLLMIIGCDNQMEFSKLYNYLDDNLDVLNDLQKRTIEVIVGSKPQISTPGIYRLKLAKRTINHVTVHGASNPYYLFDGIDSSIVPYYLNHLNSRLRQVDEYLNDPFYSFMYDLDGFMIHEEYLDDSVIKHLKTGKVYECKVDYINRNSSVDKQLAIRQIYLPIKIVNY